MFCCCFFYLFFAALKERKLLWVKHQQLDRTGQLKSQGLEILTG